MTESATPQPMTPPTASPPGHDLVPLSGASFRMGSNAGAPAEKPERSVTLPPFRMDRTLLTNEQFRVFAETSGYRTDAEQTGCGWGFDGTDYGTIPGLNWRTFATPDRAAHPVVLVSWQDAAAYAAWAGLRLPTEAEWEYTARGGLVGALYPWGDATPNGSQCSFARSPAAVPPTDPVGRYPANGFGMLDMAGHVWQWCSDWFAEDAYTTIAHLQSPVCGTHRVRRGGAWNVIQPFRLRCANRGAFWPDRGAVNIGFRCAANRLT